MELGAMRERIDAINRGILELFIERMRLSEEIARYKAANGLPILNAAREKEILDGVQSASGDLGEYSRELFEEIMRLSRERQAELFAGGGAKG